MTNSDSLIWLECLQCGKTFGHREIKYLCDCGSQIAVKRDPILFAGVGPDIFDSRLSSRKDIDRSGVWRFRELVLGDPEAVYVSHPEGSTNIYHRERLDKFAGHTGVLFKHEGENPTGSFKDRGMTVAVTQAKRFGMSSVACASTGNTSASLAAYAGQAGLRAVVFLPAFGVARGKVAQALGYGATCLGVNGDFDLAMEIVTKAAREGRVYMVNSLNPWRIEGQKTIIWELFQDLEWQAPDWIIVPGGNLGNTSAFGKAISEAYDAGWIRKKPRLVTVQAQGANPFYTSFVNNFSALKPIEANTIATAIKIGNPVNFQKAVRVISDLDGYVEEVDDDDIIAAKREIDLTGIGCEPASAATLAGLKKIVSKGIVQKGERVACVLTGHLLKDPESTLKTSRAEIQNFDPTPEAIESLFS